MKNKSRSLSKSLILFFMVFLAAILGIVVSVILVITNQTFEGSYQEGSQTALQGLSGTLKADSEKTLQAAIKLAGNSSLVDAVSKDNSYIMGSLIKDTVSSYDLSYVFITDAKGKVLSSSTTSVDSTDFSGLTHVQKALNGECTTVCEPVEGKNLSYCAASPIKLGEKIIGTVSAVYSLQDTVLLGQMKSYTGCEYTVFYGDERINTTLQVNGKRQTGTRMPADISGKVIAGKQNYSGKTNIFGSMYMAQYSPLIGPTGKAVGAVFAGKNIDNAENTLRTSVFVSIGISVLLMVISAILLSRFIKKRVKVPLDQVVRLANSMERGEIGIANPEAVALEVRYNDEVGQVSRALQSTVSTLQQYIGEISHVLSAVSEGDLTVAAEQEYYGDFSEIKNALNRILDSLRQAFSQIGESSGAVTVRSEQLSAGAMALSQGATEQASATEQLSATISDISEQVRKTAENASVASGFAQQASDEVEKGNRNLQRMMESMNEISEASSSIGKIIKTIEDIAFQTNILALNAAVEAARAGSAGRGFAVVADEVRNLAGRSAQAAKQTTELIENTVKLVSGGVKTANVTAQSFREISESTQKSTSLIQEISAATGAQAAAVTQVTNGIRQIAQVVQNNSATAQENAAASQDLSVQAESLRGQMTRFRLTAGESAEHAEPAPAEETELPELPPQGKYDLAAEG